MTDLPRLTSFRQLDDFLKKAGYPRDEQMIRNNIYIAPLDWFHIEQGFNLRPIDPEHAEGFAKSYEQGQYVPPVVAELGIVEGEPRLIIREGHHRVTGARIAVERGATLPGLVVTEFKGNKADAITLMIKSSEAKGLTPLQRAEGYKRLSGQNFSDAQIAERMGKSVSHVTRALVLANAEENVKKLVEDGLVTASIATDVLVELRGTASDPYEKLLKMIEKAKAAGRPRATGKDASKALGKFKVTPKEAVSAFSALQGLTGSLRQQMETGGDAQHELKLSPDAAATLLKILEKYEASQNPPEA
ncbi:ParB/RepB/Spo0J family partition protein [Pseudomonas aeruginosa]|uniref:ParB/Spo0J HTH domain-containing protein n=1 Tax=Pseudomonas aeruginosa TaxID=287 RepID=A0A6B1YJA6_PSEAI|nr:KorB domain-containing protein [Pseudomonas aeruginosa]MDY1103176.1 KorB domain-containing protein [Pseudomonas aeruginosa]MZZ17858.1 hypothetical protein [Pseudomonas aeruginosa]HBN9243605.1 hypothetical protein [Pseudomonas aeruginosa]HCH0556082.1 hypothetical protein [Pseudomonas aeruginosa]HCT4812715.1 hypothetical protein [Pseudomonas aeruginosa]